jgi:hypothetical protein
VRVVVESDDGRRTVVGDGVDLRNVAVDDGVDPAAVVAAVRGDGPDGLRIDCPDPGAGYPTLAHPAGDGSGGRSVRALLAAAARSRGAVAPEREALEAVRSELRELDPEPVDLRARRRRVAEAGSRETELRERAAALRGRLDALRERDAPAEAIEKAEAERREVVAWLSEAETERLAAEQSLDRARREARDRRTTRERRLRLEDRAANLERRARESLASSGAVRREFVEAVDRLSTTDDTGATVADVRGDGGDAVDSADGPAPDDGSALALDEDADPELLRSAAVVVADLAAPVVLTDRRFGGPAVAAERLGAPVVWL